MPTIACHYCDYTSPNYMSQSEREEAEDVMKHEETCRYRKKKNVKDEFKVGVKVRSLRYFSGVPKGTIGIIDEDYGDGFMVAWHRPEKNQPLPDNWLQVKDLPIGKRPFVLRDGFGKKDELDFLEVIK